MKQSFPQYALEELKRGPLTDEQLCAGYIYKYYTGFIEFLSLKKIAVIGKRYESNRKLLSEMRRVGQIEEVSREHRKYNNSDEITFKLK